MNSPAAAPRIINTIGWTFLKHTIRTMNTANSMYSFKPIRETDATCQKA